MSISRPARAVVFGCSGAALTDDERRFFADSDPLGFILFARNCENPGQVLALVDDLRGAVGRADAPVLIDQEGGRVVRLKPPHWRATPAAARFGLLARRDLHAAIEAVELNARLIAAELAAMRITVDCLPVLDVPAADADPVIGDRAFDSRPEIVAALGRAACRGLMAGGVIPVVKHVPGHGRATVDSHLRLPTVDASLPELESCDFAPFRALADMTWAMTAHVVYTAIDRDRPATTSPTVIDEVVRGWIGFDGVLISDDIAMAALTGSMAVRAAAALAAGCDLVLHCTGRLEEMREVAAAVPPLTAAAENRLARAAPSAAVPVETVAAEARLRELLGGAFAV